MSNPINDPAALVAQIQSCFPTNPIPEYPPQMGLDPLGNKDEYEGFADTAWDAVEPQHFATWGFDISPAIGFALHSPPHMWNYHVPGFMTASLLHDQEHDVTDGFMWRMREMDSTARGYIGDLPWWQGYRPFELYNREQTQCVVKYLEFIREFGAASPTEFDWEPTDELTLQRWLMRGMLLGEP